MRTSLNGRQAQWRVTVVHDTGPALQFSNVQVNCWEEVNLLPAAMNGTWFASSKSSTMHQRRPCRANVPGAAV
ncbi:hypothetical protein ABZU76_17920 [Amycolatopsis sp. NPDC005232]|uniref:hypothetical protein n=1 Tax=Amycolatopsis sp. NPDC005232 TaxID=3157027 RepID=UPI0033AED9BC